MEGQNIAAIGYYTAVNLMRGEIGTTVRFTIERGGTRYELSAVRRMVTEQVVYASMLENRVGHIRITSFDANTYRQFVTAVEQLERDGMQAVIFDVRTNPGGRLDSVMGILDYILPEGGDVVKMTYKTNEEVYANVLDYTYVNQSHPDYGSFVQVIEEKHSVEIPIAVLIN